jgi:nucleotide-binding universal stress UspA family protein
MQGYAKAAVFIGYSELMLRLVLREDIRRAHRAFREIRALIKTYAEQEVVMYGKILVPVDGSQPSAAGLREAIKIAKDQGSEIRLVHIVNDLILDGGYCTGVYAADALQVLRQCGRGVLDAAEAETRLEGVKATATLLESVAGPAAELILAEAKACSADLIVMGTHGRRGIARIVMGSDAEGVVRASRVPVLLVHGGARKSASVPRVKASPA